MRDASRPTWRFSCDIDEAERAGCAIRHGDVAIDIGHRWSATDQPRATHIAAPSRSAKPSGCGQQDCKHEKKTIVSPLKRSARFRCRCHRGLKAARAWTNRLTSVPSLRLWPSTLVRCAAAIFAESGVDRTCDGHRKNGAHDPNLTKAIAVLAHPEHVRLRSSHQAKAQRPWPKKRNLHNIRYWQRSL
jgi:hypothetical protein